MSPTSWKFGGNWPTLFKNAYFQCIFARSATAVTPTEESSINTNKKFSIRAFQWAYRWTVYVAPKPPKKAQKGSVENLNNNLR